MDIKQSKIVSICYWHFRSKRNTWKEPLIFSDLKTTDSQRNRNKWQLFCCDNLTPNRERYLKEALDDHKFAIKIQSRSDAVNQCYGKFVSKLKLSSWKMCIHSRWKKLGWLFLFFFFSNEYDVFNSWECAFIYFSFSPCQFAGAFAYVFIVHDYPAVLEHNARRCFWGEIIFVGANIWRQRLRCCVDIDLL